MRIVIGLLTGLLFGLGLVISGMTSPDRVLGFLDVAGQWDPSLAFVMGGAVLTATPLFHFARTRHKPFAGDAFVCPSTTLIDRRLIGGALLFGIGWGLAGICPGPALVGFAIEPRAVVVFMIALVVGQTLSLQLFPRKK